MCIYNKNICSVALTKDPPEEPPGQSLVKYTTITRQKERKEQKEHKNAGRQNATRCLRLRDTVDD